MGAGAEQVTKLAQNVGPNDVAVVGDLQRPALVLANVDVEMVAPEVDKHFLELPFGERAEDLGLCSLPMHRRALPAQFRQIWLCGLVPGFGGGRLLGNLNAIPHLHVCGIPAAPLPFEETPDVAKIFFHQMGRIHG